MRGWKVLAVHLNICRIFKFDHITQYLSLSHFTLGDALPGIRGFPKGGKSAIVSLYGVTVEGCSVCLHVHGFLPYFFASAPPNFKEDDCGKFRVGGHFIFFCF